MLHLDLDRTWGGQVGGGLEGLGDRPGVCGAGPLH